MGTTALRVGESEFTLEYRLAAHMVIFSHGFGVRRDARGLFTDVVTALPADMGYVLFDYNDVNETTLSVTVKSFGDQVERLKSVLAWVHEQSGITQVDLIGHSMGCLVIAELAPEGIDRLILLAPPAARGSLKRVRYTKRRGALHKDGLWYIPRSDGTTTVITDSLFDEREQIDAEGELTKLALLSPFTLVIAEADNVLLDEDYTELMTLPGVSTLGVEGANHNFSGSARRELIDMLLARL